MRIVVDMATPHSPRHDLPDRRGEQHDHDHEAHGDHRGVVERHCDVLVVGGSAAGLAAALQLGRQRRSVIVVDAGEPRNAPAAHMHSYLGHEGLPPAQLTAIGREEVRSYGGEVLDGRVERIARTMDDPPARAADHPDGADHTDRGDNEGAHLFRAELAGGHVVLARRVIAATGLVDDLPDIDGIAQHWGRDVIHCPFCHGYEVRDRRIVQILTHPMALHTAPLFRRLSERHALVVHDGTGVEDAQLDELRAAGVDVIDGPVARLVTGDDGRLTAVELHDGRRLDADAVAVAPRFDVRAAAFEPLGLRTVAHPSGLGEVVPTDPTGETPVDGLFAAGNLTDPSQQVAQAAANGSRVGGIVAVSLAQEDLRALGRSANEVDWDARYSGERMWSGNPNGALVAEVAEMATGRALDVGAGEGGDAVWLAERGWAVTANDVSSRALARVAGAAEQRGVQIELRHADANALDPFGADEFDLVVAMYASIPRTPDGRGVRNLLDAVGPGGTLLVVSHDLEPMRAPIDTATQSRAFDPDAYIRVEDVAAVLADQNESTGWAVEVHERRPRPEGAASTHHVEDVVLRARRRR